MFRFIRVIFFVLISISSCVYAASEHIDYIIDTDIGGDIDDVLTLLTALHETSRPMAITTNHIDPLVKAKIAKLILTKTGFKDIPVYAGIGTQREDSRDAFLEQNPLWPPAFGFPQAQGNERTWFPTQGLPYQERFGSEFDSMPIEQQPAPEYIVQLAKGYSKDKPLTIVAIGHLHNIAKALELAPEISQNIIIYSMGGIYPKGYNWLVAPHISAPVLSKVKTVSIISQLIDHHQFYITPDEFLDIEKNTRSLLGQAILEDWKNWYHADDEHLPKTHLSDLITLYLALHPNEIQKMQAKELTFPCLDENGLLKSEFYGLWYNMPGLENKIMVVQDTNQSQSEFVEEVAFSESVRMHLINAIKQSLWSM